MPLFRSQSDPRTSRGNVLTINGHPQPQPEKPGSMARRFRLFVECERRLADDPLAGSAAVGQPIGDGLGLEGLVAQIAPLFTHEQSLIRWVALRGAFTELFIRVFDPESAACSPAELAYAMGLDFVTDAQGEPRFDVALPWRDIPEQRQAAMGVFGAILKRVQDYNRYAKMNVADVNSDPHCQISAAVALDCIAWSAVALLRLGIAQQLFAQVPAPDALSDPGWYTDPLFAKSERFWDRSDWTARCRVRDGHQFIEVSVPLA